MVWPVSSFQESFDHFSYKRANLIWFDSALFSFRRIWAKKQKSNFFSIKTSLLIKGQYSLTHLIFYNYFDGFHENFLFDFVCVFHQILFKRQYGLITAIVSLKRILNIINIETYFNIAYYSATSLCLTSFMTRLLETFGNKNVEETALLNRTAFWNFTV